MRPIVVRFRTSTAAAVRSLSQSCAAAQSPRTGRTGRGSPRRTRLRRAAARVSARSHRARSYRSSGPREKQRSRGCLGRRRSCGASHARIRLILNSLRPMRCASYFRCVDAVMPEPNSSNALAPPAASVRLLESAELADLATGRDGFDIDDRSEDLEHAGRERTRRGCLGPEVARAAEGHLTSPSALGCAGGVLAAETSARHATAAPISSESSRAVVGNRLPPAQRSDRRRKRGAR